MALPAPAAGRRAVGGTVVLPARLAGRPHRRRPAARAVHAARPATVPRSAGAAPRHAVLGGGHARRPGDVRRPLGVAVPTLYLCLIDRLAVGWGLWQFSAVKLTGWTVLGLPVEEATFFLLTNALVVHGLVLFHPFVEGWRGFGLPGTADDGDA
ncbi:hypothetical protein BRD10_03065 [Halobacteriales archaeon SW_12_71_31]|nr:MAG: hypothetical protein BRD10_03065 [Halobacteriales archaeon SW_12_71_31]